MNRGFFTGRVAKKPVFRNGGSEATPVCFFTLLNNEYAGKDAKGESVERKVAISFTAFGPKAKLIAEQSYEGDQLIVSYRVMNNDREKDGIVSYNFSFIVDEISFGAPGKIKRERLAKTKEDGSDNGL